jgi:hypothetical protein
MPTGPKGEKHSADAGYIRTSDGIGGAAVSFGDSGHIMAQL